MASEYFFHAAGRQTMTGDINNVVRARHDIEIAILIDKAGITGFIIAGVILQIGGFKAILVLP